MQQIPNLLQPDDGFTDVAALENDISFV